MNNNKSIKAFFKHSHISLKILNRTEARNAFCYIGRLYAGYVGMYAAIPLAFNKLNTNKRIYITIWLFKPTPECKQLMIKSGKY